MPYHLMGADEARAFLSSDPPRTGSLATVRSDGRPHVVPVWFALEADGTVVFQTGVTSVKGGNLRRTGWASMCVDDQRPPFSFVAVEGPVAFDEDPDRLLYWATVIGGRYMGADRAEEFGRRNGVPGEMVVRLTPKRIVTGAELSD